MLPTLVIGLREGLEASLIVGIIAAFLRREGNLQAMRVLWLGVLAAVLLCAAVGIGLRVAEENLPQKQQEGLETIISLLAVGMVTYMLLWMKKNARSIKKDLEGHLSVALASGSATALIFMAFMAVLREGFETAVFLVAAFQQSTDAQATGSGAVLGIVIACVVGYGIYKGGVRLNLAKFFSVTAFVLVLVAAGLFATAIHTSHEAGWFNGLQGQALDLTWLVKPGTVISALLTGMFGLQPRPTVGETLGWLVYFVPVMLLVMGWGLPTRLFSRPAVKDQRPVSSL